MVDVNMPGGKKSSKNRTLRTIHKILLVLLLVSLCSAILFYAIWREVQVIKFLTH